MPPKAAKQKPAFRKAKAAAPSKAAAASSGLNEENEVIDVSEMPTPTRGYPRAARYVDKPKPGDVAAHARVKLEKKRNANGKEKTKDPSPDEDNADDSEGKPTTI